MRQMVLIQGTISNLLLLTEARHLPGSEIKAFVSFFPTKFYLSLLKFCIFLLNARGPLIQHHRREWGEGWCQWLCGERFIVSGLFVMFMKNPYYQS